MTRARSFRSAFVVTIAVVGLIASATTAGAGAPRISVSPKNGVASGRNVVVKGTGFGANDSVALMLCPRYGGNPFTSCMYPWGYVATDASGSFKATGKLHIRGQNFFHDAVDCAATPCVLAAIEGGPPGGLIAQAGRSVTFQPKVAEDCKLGHWRNLAYDTGARFTDQKRCVAFANAHPHS